MAIHTFAGNLNDLEFSWALQLCDRLGLSRNQLVKQLIAVAWEDLIGSPRREQIKALQESGDREALDALRAQIRADIHRAETAPTLPSFRQKGASAARALAVQTGHERRATASDDDRNDGA